jgi:hypothetical protein
MFSRMMPSKGDPDYKSLRDYTDDELIAFLEKNESMTLSRLSGITSEILRRMNEKSPLL